ncbi:hypothetical protein [Virgibacillus sp. YIM 98842]|uniref:hypothetical protein n=1 Tax=Virgibacillus sp. YIM 98842 TaxID=2663533 RepID=UPI0013DC3563|nr:hypothetical protein [Virgibacillus sp. YIM 98842]
MMVELLTELFADSSSMYFYFSIFLSGIGTIKFTQFGLNRFIGNTHVAIRKCHAAKIQTAPILDSIGEATEIMDWIVRKTKRIEAPDDDNTDNHVFSFLQNYGKKRGGQRWDGNLYSLSQINIA